MRQRFHITLINGERVWVTGQTIDDVFDAAFRKYAYLYRGVCDKWDDRPQCPTVKGYGETWLETYKKPKIGASRYRLIRGLFRNHVFPVIGEKRLDDVRFEDAQAVIDKMNGLAKGSKELAIKTARDMFNYAIEDKHIEDNVFKSKKLDVNGATHIRRSMSNDEVTTLINSCENLNMVDKLIIMIPLYAGLRLGEVCALKWEDIDFDKRLIHVQRNVALGYDEATIEKEPKTKAGNRFVPMPDELYNILKGMPHTNEYIITSSRRRKNFTRDGFATHFAALRKMVSIPDDISYHCFRHTFATAMSTKVDPKTLQAILGHADITTTMNTYVHRDKETVQGFAYLFKNLYE